ncbi:MAG: hypothetical protein WCC37_19730 [Candidatus Sulfotelmatobacter sp.]
MRSKRDIPFDAEVYLESVGVSRKVREFRGNVRQQSATRRDAFGRVSYMKVLSSYALR